MPAGHFVRRDAETLVRDASLEVCGRNRSSRPMSTRVGTGGQLSKVQGDAKTVLDWRGSPCAQASSITGCGTSWKKSMSRVKGGVVRASVAPILLALRRAVAAYCVHHAPGVSPGLGIMAFTSTSNATRQLLADEGGRKSGKRLRNNDHSPSLASADRPEPLRRHTRAGRRCRLPPEAGLESPHVRFARVSAPPSASTTRFHPRPV